MKIINPDNVVKPASNYAQGIVHSAAAERIVISGQLGVKPDGTIEEGLEAQMARAWSNVFAVMAEGGFISASANVQNLDPEAAAFPIVTERRDAELKTIMSNSFGFGGTNATLVFSKA